MSKSLVEPSQERKITHNRFQIKDTRQKPLAFSWWEPDCVEGDGCTAAQAAVVLENNWQQPSLPLEPYAFRLHADGSLEFKGHLDASGGASLGNGGGHAARCERRGGGLPARERPVLPDAHHHGRRLLLHRRPGVHRFDHG